MREIVLRQFFEGHAAAAELARDVVGTRVADEPPERWLWDTDTPDGERVAEALFWLGTPEISYPLTPPVPAKVRHYLLTGENTLGEADLAPR